MAQEKFEEVIKRVAAGHEVHFHNVVPKARFVPPDLDPDSPEEVEARREERREAEAARQPQVRVWAPQYGIR